MISTSSLYGRYRQNKFSDVFTSLEAFTEEFETNSIFGSNSYDPSFIGKTMQSCGNRFSPKLLYYLLMGNYANSIIASSDINRFKIKFWSIIYQYGPMWAKKMDIQDKVRALSEEEITVGSKVVHNTAMNPSNDPSETDGILSYINQQNTSKYQKSKLEGYQILWSTIISDPTKEFVDKFQSLFLQVLEPEAPLLYEEVSDE